MKRIFMPLAAALCAVASPVFADESPVPQAGGPDSARLYELQQIEVTSTRVDRRTPVAYSDIGREEIARRNFGSDMPSLLRMTPSVVATSDAGNGIGSTAFRLRGSDASRINVTANGVPMNDAESHRVYWYDTPDVASSVGTIQIQRGAGTSTNGTGAFGGSVNMTTAPLSNEFSGEASLSYGSYNTNKQSLRIGSGMLGDRWIIDARLSHVFSEGYVERASSDLKSYMLQAGYYNGATVVKLLSFGGHARVGLAYDGVTKEQLRTDRRYNSQGIVKHADGSVSFYDDQTDNYTQINNQLIVNHRFNARWTLNATGHYTYGSGYYNQYKNGQDLSEYGIAPIPTDDPALPITESNLIRRKSMKTHFGGAVVSANYTKGRVRLALGGAANMYDGLHWGRVLSLVAAPDFRPYEYYSNTSAKYDANLFAKINWEAARGLNLYADLQYRHIRHDITGTNDNFSSVTSTLQTLDIRRRYDFFNPKAGINYSFAKHHKAYLSFAVAQKEPTRNNFTDTRGDEQPVAERLYDWELGYLYADGRFEAGVNLYYMSYKDQLVATGELSDTGQEHFRNNPQSYRRGVELSAS
ncbi:MAG: TonB-dependent receptor, partial [Alistipes sp.]|nr:TonB-dependent receptor [Alistipes sp.]